ncbi:acyl-CoA thioesterase [Streptomyces sp. NPDC087300]|uniref:acyl-CoA thioesterase n=1 Tax=Streptomyces sp. NPDC087300 TaxID=3365780 RepID=UPI0037FFAD8E
MPQRIFVRRVSIRATDQGDRGVVDDIAQLSLAREAMLALLGIPHNEPHPSGPLFPHGVIALRHEVILYREVKYRHEPLPIEVWVDEIGDVVFSMQSRARARGKALFGVHTVFGARDAHSLKPRALSEQELERLREHTVPRLKRSPHRAPRGSTSGSAADPQPYRPEAAGRRSPLHP